MTSKPGIVKLCLFLVSIFLCSDLFSQLVVSMNTVAAPAINIDRVIVNPGKISFAGSFALYLPDIESVVIVFNDTTKKKDRDGDGIFDSSDKCPDEKGTLQYDGCPVPDSDNDGITDDIDACPTVRGLPKYKGCPAPDKDGDKINDEDDRCPNGPGVARYDGCPVGDKDKDGINDDDDKCIDVAGTIDDHGCPKERKGVKKPGILRSRKNEKS